MAIGLQYWRLCFYCLLLTLYNLSPADILTRGFFAIAHAGFFLLSPMHSAHSHREVPKACALACVGLSQSTAVRV